MRLIGSFQTTTIHGRSCSSCSLSAGRPSPTTPGADVEELTPPLCRSGRLALGRRGLRRLDEPEEPLQRGRVELAAVQRERRDQGGEAGGGGGPPRRVCG